MAKFKKQTFSSGRVEQIPERDVIREGCTKGLTSMFLSSLYWRPCMSVHVAYKNMGVKV